MLVIKGGRIVDPGRQIDAVGDVWLDGDKIKKVVFGGENLDDSTDVQVIDCLLYTSRCV